jgi:leucine dehydrogenase
MEVGRSIGAGPHEQVLFVADPAVGLQAIIAIHSTALGPALGGVRFWRYASGRDHLDDALRLSEAMTLKAAVAGLDQGGGKAVVCVDDPSVPRSAALLRSLGRAIDRLGGRYVAAEDVGATQADMDALAEVTPWVTGIDPARGGSGDPSPATAVGVFHSVRAVVGFLFDDDSLAGRSVVVQGAGHVASHLVPMLTAADASVVVADVDEARARRLADAHGAEVVAADRVLDLACDVLAPCALGGVISSDVARDLRCAAVCGAANNQLADPGADDVMAARGIVYAPDFVVNAGGILNLAQEWAPDGYSRERALAAAAAVGDTVAGVLEESRRSGVPPARTAEEIAWRRIRAEGRGRFEPGMASPMAQALRAR